MEDEAAAGTRTLDVPTFPGTVFQLKPGLDEVARTVGGEEATRTTGKVSAVLVPDEVIAVLDHIALVLDNVALTLDAVVLILDIVEEDSMGVETTTVVGPGPQPVAQYFEVVVKARETPLVVASAGQYVTV